MIWAYGGAMSATNHACLADDGFGRYLSSAAQTPLLSREEEEVLGRIIRAWLDSDNPSEDVVRMGKQALDHLVSANLLLVVNIAKRYAYSTSLMNEIDDLVQEGNIALIGAAADYNPDFGNRFSTFAVYRIRQAISRALQITDVPVPVHIKERLLRLSRVQSAFYGAHGRNPSIAELASMMGVQEEDVRHLLNVQSLTVTSLSHPVYDGDRLVEEVIADDRSPGSPADMERRETEIDVHELLSSLPIRERMMVQRWFGIGGEPESLTRIAQSYRVSRERVRQIIAESLRRMRDMQNHRTTAPASHAPCEDSAAWRKRSEESHDAVDSENSAKLRR